MKSFVARTQKSNVLFFECVSGEFDMSDSEQPTSTPAMPTTVPAISTVRIAQPIPVLFVDGVPSQSFTAGVAKFYFNRIDPDPAAAGPPSIENVLQIVMPAESFVVMTA